MTAIRMPQNMWRWSGVGCLFLMALPPLFAQQPTVSRTLAAGSGPVHVAFSPDGKTLASAARDELKLWHVGTGKHTATLKGDGGAWAVAFSPDGKTLACASGPFGIDWKREAPDTLWAWAFVLPDGAAHFTAIKEGLVRKRGADDIRLWAVPTAKPTAVLKGDAGTVWSVTFSPDGKALASSHQDGTVKLWDVATGLNTATLKGHTAQFGPSFFGPLAFSPDGKSLASGGGPVVNRTKGRVTGEIKLWDVATGKPTRILEAHTGEGCFMNLFAVPFCLSFSPDGKTLASGGSRTIELWDVATGTNISALPSKQIVHAVAFSPDGKTVAAGGGSFGSLGARDEEGKTLPGEITLLDVATGKVTATLKSRPGGVWSVAFSPDGRTLASGEAEGTVTLWELPAAEGKAK